jgi:hypothetical protein
VSFLAHIGPQAAQHLWQLGTPSWLLLGDGTDVGLLGRPPPSCLPWPSFFLSPSFCMLLRVVEAITMLLAKVATTLYRPMM